MSRYDGLIIPRSYSEYINKTDAATLQQALQLSGVLSGAVAAGDNKAVKSSAVNEALKKINISDQITRNEDLTYQYLTVEKQLNIVRGYILFTTTAPIAKETPIITGMPRMTDGYVDIPIFDHAPDTFTGYARVNQDGSVVSAIPSLPAGEYRISFIYMCVN
jgi:hypothetical protein